ncbi:hypothetical protein CBL_09324 [Carabus blaptoides fortunei]
MKFRIIVYVGVYARASVNSKIRISANGTFMITRHKYHLLVLRAQKQAESTRISAQRVTKPTLYRDLRTLGYSTARRKQSEVAMVQCKGLPFNVEVAGMLRVCLLLA